jgi:hypothetical protein
MLADPDETVAAKDQVDVVLLQVMEVLLPPFYQIRRYCEQLTPLKLHKENQNNSITSFNTLILTMLALER